MKRGWLVIQSLSSIPSPSSTLASLPATPATQAQQPPSALKVILTCKVRRVIGRRVELHRIFYAVHFWRRDYSSVLCPVISHAHNFHFFSAHSNPHTHPTATARLLRLMHPFKLASLQVFSFVLLRASSFVLLPFRGSEKKHHVFGHCGGAKIRRGCSSFQCVSPCQNSPT